MKKIVIVLVGMLLMACTMITIGVKHDSPNFKDGTFRNKSGVEALSLWEMIWADDGNIEMAEWPDSVETQVDEEPLKVFNSSDIRVTFINHATFLIQTANLNILTDPVFSERVSPLSFAGPKRIHKPGIDIENLPEIDVVIISHDHYDHLDLASANKLIKRDNPKVYVGLGLAKILTPSSNVTEMDWWESIQVTDNFKLWFLDVQHNSGRSIINRNSTLWGGFMLQVGDKNIYFGGDSGYADHYQRTYEHFGPVDLAFIPIGAYSPRNIFKRVHMDPYDAVQAHIDLKAKLSIGMHYGTFQLTAESHTEPVELLEKAKFDADIPADEFITLDIGKPFNFLGSPSKY